MNKIFDFLKKNKFHFIGWAAFIAYEASVVGFFTSEFLRPIDYFVPYVLNISLFYVHALIIVPFALNQQKNKIITLMLLLILEVAVYATLLLFVIPAILKTWNIHLVTILKLEFQYYITRIWRLIYFLGLSTTYYLFRRLERENRRNIKLNRMQFINVIERKNAEKELIKSNYNQLRAQINPRLLFKVLTFLHEKTKRTSERASNAILVLSEMMRYSLADLDNKDFVLVSEEAEQVKNLIYLNQLRFDNKIYIDFVYSKEAAEVRIIPLVLLTLVENMFKHGNLSVPENNASINIYVEDKVLQIKTVNSLTSYRNNVGYNSGLENTKKRLEFTYGSTSSLKYVLDNDKKCFIVLVKIPVLSMISSKG